MRAKSNLGLSPLIGMMKKILLIVVTLCSLNLRGQTGEKIIKYLSWNNFDNKIPILLICLSPPNRIVDAQNLREIIGYADSLQYTKVVILFKNIRYHEVDSIFPLHYGIHKPSFPIIISDSIFNLLSYEGKSFVCYLNMDTIIVKDIDLMKDAEKFLVELVQREKLIEPSYTLHTVFAPGYGSYSTLYYNDSMLYLIDVLSDRVLRINLKNDSTTIIYWNYKYKEVFYELYQGYKHFNIDESTFDKGEKYWNGIPHHVIYNSNYSDSVLYLMMFYEYGYREKNRFPMLYQKVDSVYGIYSVKVFGRYNGKEVKYFGLPAFGFPRRINGSNFLINTIGNIDDEYYLFSTYSSNYNIDPDSSYYVAVFKRYNDTLRFFQFLPNTLPDTAIKNGNGYTYILAKGFKYKKNLYFYIKGTGDCYAVVKDSSGFTTRIVQTSFINNENNSAEIEHITETSQGKVAVLVHKDDSYILTVYKKLYGEIEKRIILPSYFSTNSRFFLTSNELIALKFDDYFIKYAIFKY